MIKRDEDGFPVRGTTYDPTADPSDLRYTRQGRCAAEVPALSDYERAVILRQGARSTAR